MKSIMLLVLTVLACVITYFIATHQFAFQTIDPLKALESSPAALTVVALVLGAVFIAFSIGSLYFIHTFLQTQSQKAIKQSVRVFEPNLTISEDPDKTSELRQLQRAA